MQNPVIPWRNLLSPPHVYTHLFLHFLKILKFINSEGSKIVSNFFVPPPLPNANDVIFFCSHILALHSILTLSSNKFALSFSVWACNVQAFQIPVKILLWRWLTFITNEHVRVRVLLFYPQRLRAKAIENRQVLLHCRGFSPAETADCGGFSPLTTDTRTVVVRSQRG